MSTAGISFGGLASGLDTKAIIAALVAVERRPIAQLEQKKTALNKQKDLFGDLGNLLRKLSDSAVALKRTTDFLAMRAASDDEALLTASASGSATPGSHRVQVVALATAEVRSSNGRADRNATSYGDGTLQIDVGGRTHFISFGAGTGYASTLDGIAQAINGADIDVAADVVDTGGTGANRFQLVVRGKTTGSAGDFSIEVDSSTNSALDALIAEINLPANQRTGAQDAHIRLNGIDVHRSSNSIADAIPGVTIELRAADQNKTVTLTISTNAEETSKKVKDLVDAYNKVVDFFTTQNERDSEGRAKNPLFGDTTLRSIRSSLRSQIGAVVGTGNMAYQMLAQIGVTSDTQGKLTLNQSKFEEALATDERAVAAIFTDAANGIAGKLETQIKTYTDSVDGLLGTRRQGFDRMIKQTQSRIDQSERRLEQYEKQLTQRYAALEQQLSRLQGQGSSLSGISASYRR